MINLSQVWGGTWKEEPSIKGRMVTPCQAGKEGNKQVVGENRAALFPQNWRIDSYSNERPFALEIEALEHAVPCHSVLCLAVKATETEIFVPFSFYSSKV